jgi:hypothetical protein
VLWHNIPHVQQPQPKNGQNTPFTNPELQPESSEPEPRASEPDPPHNNVPNARKEEVSAEVPKIGVSGESFRPSHFQIPTYEKDKA